MAKRKDSNQLTIKDMIPAPVQPQLITETIEKNYMPYVMSVIISRAIPEIDGLKPAHRKLLYMMYKMGLLTGGRTKSANVVGATMKLNPHGDASIYETMVRLTRGNETLLHPLIDSKGSFGKVYSSDMKYAAARYTEVKLDTFCETLFAGIDKNAVDMVPNYDNTMEEPVLLPTAFPNVLVMPNTGIAVGMASNICSFNLNEICDGTIALLRKPSLTVDKLMEIIKAPDFPCGGTILYDPAEMREVFETGSGSITIRSRYKYDKENNCIDILQIPYTTSIEIIMKKIQTMVKEGKLKEITDFRDEIDLNGFKLTLDLRRGVNPDKLMQKLFSQTTLQDAFKCNFNILIDSVPKQMGVLEILQEWIKFRIQCIKRELAFDLDKKQKQLHLLLGLGKILLDIDKAIRIIRRTEKEEDVVPNLMEGFDIDKIQADYIAEIKLRHLNRQYILNRIAEIEDLQKEIAEIESILADELKQKAYIANQLVEIKKKYGKPRLTQIVGADTVEVYNEVEEVEEFKGKIFFTAEGYLKKVAAISLLRGGDAQKMKEGDYIVSETEVSNDDNLIFLTDRAQLWRAKVSDFEMVKSSQIGEYVPAKLGMESGEKAILMHIQNKYPPNENLVFIFENGKGVRVPIQQYEITSNRKKMTGAYSKASPIVAAFYENEKNPLDILIYSDDGRAIVIKSSLIPLKATKTASGNTLMSLKKGAKVTAALTDYESRIEGKVIKKQSVPATGSPIVLKPVIGAHE